MSNPCDADILVGQDGRRRYNFLRWMVTGLLGTLLLLVTARGCQFSRLQAPTLNAPTGNLAPGVLNLTGTSDEAKRVGLLVTDGPFPPANTITIDQLADGTVDENGNWTIQTQALPAGTYTAQAFAIDPDNGVQRSSEPVQFTIPQVNTVVAPSPDTGDDNASNDPDGSDNALIAPVLAGVSNMAAPGPVTLGGTGAPDSQIDIDINGTRVGAATVATDGNWEYTTATLETGEYSATAHAVDNSGNRVGASEPVMWVVGDVALATPTLSLPEGDIAPNASVTIAGTGSPGTTVEVFQNGRTIGAAPVDEEGRWSLGTVIDSYSSEFTAVGRTTDGAEIGRTAPQTLIVPAAAATLAVAAAPTFGNFSADADGNSSTTFSWAGSGQPGATVEAFASGVTAPIGTTTVDESGNWQLDGTVALPAGDYAVSARQLDTAGNVLSSSESVQITVPQLADSGNSTATLTRIQSGRDPLDPITIFGTGVANSSVTVGLNDAEIGTVPTDADGQWQVSTPSPGAGDHRVRIDGADIGGFMLSDAGTGVTIDTIDTSGNQFTAAGQAAANAAVELYLNDTLAGRVDSDEAGRWRYEGEAADGVNSLRAEALGAASLAPIASLDTLFGNDAAIRIDSVMGGNGQAQFFGLAAPNSQVQMVIDGRVVDVVSTDASGAWDYGGSYADGQYQLVARQLDVESGRALYASAAQPFIIQGGATIGTDSGLLQLVFSDQPSANIRPSARDVNGFLVDGPAIHLVVDSSYSMRLNLAGDIRLEVTDPNARIAIARRTLQSVISGLPEGVPFSMRAFGHIENTSETTCHTALEVPVQPLVRDGALAKLAEIRPRFLTDTPIAESLAAVADDLAGVNRKIVVVLVTDGDESCGGDPLAAVQSLRDAGIDFQLDVVGLSVDGADRGLLEQLAAAGNGRYFDAQSSAELAAALGDSLLTPYRVLDEAGNVVTTGVVGGQPVRLPPGRYRAEVLSAEPRSFNMVVRAGQTTLEQIE